MRALEFLSGLTLIADEPEVHIIGMILNGCNTNALLNKEEARDIESIITSMIDIPEVPGISLEQRALRITEFINRDRQPHA